MALSIKGFTSQLKARDQFKSVLQLIEIQISNKKYKFTCKRNKVAFKKINFFNQHPRVITTNVFIAHVQTHVELNLVDRYLPRVS